MHSILMMAVLSGAGTAPGQYYYGPCGGVYYGPPVAYYPVERVVAVGQSSGYQRKPLQEKVDELAAMINRIKDRLEKVENRFQVMEEKHRELAQTFDRKLQEQAKHQQMALEGRIKEERVRQELEAVKEKTRFLEYSAKILAQDKQQQDRGRLEKIQHHMEKLEAQLKKVEKTLNTMTSGNRNRETTSSDSEASEGQADIPENRALIIVTVPANARLFLNDQLRKGKSRQRFILTPPLDGGDHSITLRVEADRDGRVQSQTRQVNIRRGTHVRVTFEP